MAMSGKAAILCDSEDLPLLDGRHPLPRPQFRGRWLCCAPRYDPDADLDRVIRIHWSLVVQVLMKMTLPEPSPLPVDPATIETELWRPGQTKFALEPIFVPRRGAIAEDDGYILMLLHNGETGGTEFAILDAQRISDGAHLLWYWALRGYVWGWSLAQAAGACRRSGMYCVAGLCGTALVGHL